MKIIINMFDSFNHFVEEHNSNYSDLLQVVLTCNRYFELMDYMVNNFGSHCDCPKEFPELEEVNSIRYAFGVKPIIAY